ncbi:MAG TPA: CsgG/HfaB family protein, partial [Anaerolineae bacterium]|nr:CsgG/HfaB family protein [Anaerolineae bacterium]
MSPSRLTISIALAICLGAPAWGQVSAAAPAVAIIGVGQERQSPELQSLQAGLVHLVQSELGSRSGARVVSRSRTALFLEELGLGAAQLTEPETGQRFGQAAAADYLVLVQLVGDGELRATVTAVQVSSGRQVWSAGFTGPQEALPTLAAETAGALVEALALPPVQVPAFAAGPAPMLAVLDFRSEGAAGPLDRHLADLSDLLSVNLTALEVPLVERQKLEAVLEELGLSASGLVRTTDMAKVGRLLGAERMLSTSMIASGPTVMLDSQVIQPETGLVVASCRVATEPRDLPASIQELAAKVASALRVPVTEAGRAALARQATGSLEAALHAAAGWRLGQEGRAEEAVKEYQQAIYLDPTAVWWWLRLAEQYQAMGDNEHYGQAMQRFLALAEGKADPQDLSQVACALADAEIWQGHGAESEAAARLAIHYYENQDGYYRLMHALSAQGKMLEARRFCDSLVGREEVPHYQLVRAWDFLLGWFANRVRENPRDDDIRQELDNVSRVLDIFEDGDEEADRYLSVQLANALLGCSTGSTPDAIRLDGRGTYLEACLALAQRMTTEFSSGVAIPGRGWFVTGLLEYKLGDYEAAITALQRCLQDYPGVNFDTGSPRTRSGPASGFVHYLLGRTYQQQGERRKAIESYQRALMMLDSGRAEAQDSLKRLQALGEKQPPPSPWLRRVGGAGRPVEAPHRQRLAHWLRTEGYDLRLDGNPTRLQQLAAQGIQVLVWEGRSSDYASAEEIRSYIAGGGNLLICLTSQPYIDVIGPILATSSQTMDLSLNWLLPAFGMGMSNRAQESRGVPFETSGAELAIELGESASYEGIWFPLEVGPGMSVVTIGHGADNQKPEVVAAASIGLGKVAVVSLRDWFPGADTNSEREPWQYDLLEGILDWFAN